MNIKVTYIPSYARYGNMIDERPALNEKGKIYTRRAYRVMLIDITNLPIY